jgi:hypothetical protein
LADRARRAPCRGRTGILLVEGQVRYPLLQRSMIVAYAAEESNPDRRRLEAGRAFRYASGACPPKESNPHPMA